MLGFIAGLMAGIGIFVGGWAFMSRNRIFGAIEVILAILSFVLSLLKPGVLTWYLIVIYVLIVGLSIFNLLKIRSASKCER